MFFYSIELYEERIFTQKESSTHERSYRTAGRSYFELISTMRRPTVSLPSSVDTNARTHLKVT